MRMACTFASPQALASHPLSTQQGQMLSFGDQIDHLSDQQVLEVARARPVSKLEELVKSGVWEVLIPRCSNTSSALRPRRRVSQTRSAPLMSSPNTPLSRLKQSLSE